MPSVDVISGSMATEQPVKLESEHHRLDRRVFSWCLVSSLLLIGMGVVRGVQAHRYEVSQTVDATAPFPLKDLPTAIDGWRVVDGTDTQLDPLTTRTTGSTDHVIRSYFDEITGVMLTVLVLYGPAEPMMPHVPQICYPASGFRSIAQIADFHLRINDSLGAIVRSSVFSKSGGRSVLNQAVYHTYRVDDEWTPNLTGRRLSTRNTGVFKIQVARRVVDGERLGSDEPIESFLKKLIPVVETMTVEAANHRNGKVLAAPTATQSTPPGTQATDLKR